MSKRDLSRPGRSAATQQARAFNTREGLTPSTDTLPKRFLREETAEGASLSEDELSAMLIEYNQIRSARTDADRT